MFQLSSSPCFSYTMVEQNGVAASDVSTSPDQTVEEDRPKSIVRDDRRAADGTKERLQRSVLLFLLGAPSLERLQQIIDEEDTEKKKEKSWSELRNVLTDRTNNINVVSALVVASSSVFLSTPAPTPHMSLWNADFPYFCMLLGFGCAMLAIVSGFAEIVCLSLIGPEDIRLARERTLTRVALLVLLMLPLAWLLVASLSIGVAFTSAVWLGEVLWMKVLFTAGYAMFLFNLFLITLVLL